MDEKPRGQPPLGEGSVRRHETIAGMGRYRSFRQLTRHTRPGVDFVIRFRPGRSGVLIMAPHGGAIEPGTAEIAEAVAGGNHGFYSFEGLRRRSNGELHITSTCFDEPTAMRAASACRTVVAVHGCKGFEPFVKLGGRDERLKDRVRKALEKRGFKVTEDPRLPGRSARNICNRGTTGMGVQLEVSAGLRKVMFQGIRRASAAPPTEVFLQFVEALRGVLSLA